MKRRRLTTYTIKKMIRCFYEDLTATQISIFGCVNRKHSKQIFNLIREAIFKEHEINKNLKEEGVVFELDKSYLEQKESELKDEDVQLERLLYLEY